MKTIVIGGAGFIGSHLCDRLVELGHFVICIDNLSNGNMNNINQLILEENFKFIQMDATNYELINDLFKVENPEYIFHLAANSDIQASSNNPNIEYQNTFTTTFSILEAMRNNNISNIFFASTSAVYGENHLPLSEETTNLKPVSYYGAFKLGSEAMINAYSEMNNLNSLIFRFPNVIGSRLTHGVVFDFINKLKKDSSKLVILGNGKQSKPYLYIDDLIDAIILLFDTNKKINIYNIGVDTLTSVDRIAEIIIKKMGLTNTIIEYTGGSKGWNGDVPTFKYDLKKISRTGWKPTLSSDEAIIKSVELGII